MRGKERLMNLLLLLAASSEHSDAADILPMSSSFTKDGLLLN
jgi:hypothetical protein